MVRSQSVARGGPITLAWVQRRVKVIEQMAGDDEAAHSEEDALHRKVLGEIASDEGRAAELAAAALKTRGIDFQRWCA